MEFKAGRPWDKAERLCKDKEKHKGYVPYPPRERAAAEARPSQETQVSLRWAQQRSARKGEEETGKAAGEGPRVPKGVVAGVHDTREGVM